MKVKPTDEKNLVLDIAWAHKVQIVDLVEESFPLGLHALGVECTIRRIGLTDQAEVSRHLVNMEQLSVMFLLLCLWTTINQ